MIFILAFEGISFFTFAFSYFNNDIIIERLKDLAVILTLVFLCVISGTRTLGGSDFYVYQKSYQVIPTIQQVMSGIGFHSGSFWTKNFEDGYLIIESIFKSLGFTFRGFCIIHSLFVYSCVYIGLKKYCNNFFIVLIVFLDKMFFYDTFISMRQSITIAIFLISLNLIRENKLFKYLLVCLFCIYIHTASIIMIPIYFINKLNVNKRRMLIFILILAPFALMNMLNINIFVKFATMLSSVFSNSFLGPKLVKYTQEAIPISKNYYIEFFAIALLVYFNYEKLSKENDNFDFILKLFFILYILYSFLGGFNDVVVRERDYFILTYGILLNWLIEVDNYRYRLPILLILISLCGHRYFSYIINFDNGHLSKNTSWLFELFRK